MNDSPRTQSTAVRVLEFEGLRGFLSWWVVIDHMLMACGYSVDTLPRGLRLLCHGDYAVDVFMILSGFVIFNLLHDAGEPYVPFLIRRFFRLYPVYAFCMAVSVLFLPLVWDNSQHWPGSPVMQAAIRNWYNDSSNLDWHLLAHATLLHGAIPNAILPGSAVAVLPPAWSVSLEWQFYLIAPLLFLLFRGKGYCRLMVFTVFAAVVTWFTQYRFSILFINNAFLPQRILMFLVGIISYLLWRQRKMDSDAPAIFLAGLSPLILFFTLSIPLALWSVVMAAAMSGNGAFGSRVAGLFTHPAIQKLGRISYSTYLVHVCCITAIQWLLFKMMPGAGPKQMFWMLLVPCVAAVYFVSCGMHRWIEVPGMRLGRRLTSK